MQTPSAVDCWCLPAPPGPTPNLRSEVITMPDSHIDSEKLDAKLDRLEKQLDAAKAERKSIQLLMTFLTTIITAVVGFGGWLIQSHVQQHIDDQTHGLETRLALEQQVYAKELAAYESVHQQMANLVQSLSQVPV